MKYKKKNKNVFKYNWKLIVSGIAVGGINGFFGGGGGMLCVPLLEKTLNIDNKRSHATSIAVMLPISSISAIIYLMSNEIPILDSLFTSIGAVVGGVLGALILCRLNTKVVRFIFALIVIIAGVKMVIG